MANLPISSLLEYILKRIRFSVRNNLNTTFLEKKNQALFCNE